MKHYNVLMIYIVVALFYITNVFQTICEIVKELVSKVTTTTVIITVIIKVIIFIHYDNKLKCNVARAYVNQFLKLVRTSCDDIKRSRNKFVIYITEVPSLPALNSPVNSPIEDDMLQSPSSASSQSSVSSATFSPQKRLYFVNEDKSLHLINDNTTACVCVITFRTAVLHGKFRRYSL